MADKIVSGLSPLDGRERLLELLPNETTKSFVISETHDIYMIWNAGVPSDGAAGTGAGITGTGSLCIDYTNAKLYINTNTKASPLWTVVGEQVTP